MNKTRLALAASVVTIVVLGSELHAKNLQLKNLRSSATKLSAWSEIAHKVVTDAWTKHPELIKEMPSEIKNEIEFYNIIAKENLY